MKIGEAEGYLPTGAMTMEQISAMDKKRDLLLSNEAEEKQAIRDFFQNATIGFFVEVGANEPTEPESQTWHLEQMGWRGILIEPIPDLANKARLTRPNAKVWQVACTSSAEEGSVEFLIPIANQQLVTGHASLRANIDEHNYTNFEKIKVQTTTLSNILANENVDYFDFLSIDVEGAELEVLLGLDLKKYRPKLILLEDKHLYLSKHRHLKKNGYKIAQRLNRNSWYIPTELKSPSTSFKSKLKLWKRMFISIWFKKIQYSFRHGTLTPFKTL
jgi:FkbM family methyltransferase